MRRFVAVLLAGAMVAAFAAISAAGASTHGANPLSQRSKQTAPSAHWCNSDGVTCAEPFQRWQDFPFFNKLRQQGVKIGEYIGHDEPSVLFYSQKAGSGNDNTYLLTLPKDPPVRPIQDGSGGTWNFQLHPAFWFGMALCDNQSAPNPRYSGAAYRNVPCTPNSDTNIFTNTSASDPHYLGKHPGTAFMEMQFYPPGWVKWPVGNSCDATQWCAALNIDSLSIDENNNVANNTDCLNTAGIEPVNFAYITKNGTATSSASPLNPARFDLNASKDFFMNSGDQLSVHLHDTMAGFQVAIKDVTAGTAGSMEASAANGFGSVVFDPGASSCSVTTHAFHPEYSTSSPKTRVPWAAHSYNVAYSDEIGHFEYCSKVNVDSILSCAKPGGFDTNAGDPQDDNYCLPVPGFGSTKSSLIKIKGCLGILGDSDIDFDGVSYDAHAWPGSNSNPIVDRMIAPTPIRFTSPTFGGGSNFGRVAFEADLPRIEDFRPDSPFGGVGANCQRFIANPADPNPGKHCVNPPPQSRFYPIYTTTSAASGQCWWQEGGKYIPGTVNNFGGTPRKEFGPLLVATYPVSPPGTVSTRYNDFRKIMPNNPCPA
jgi:hypothetical protein